MTDPANITRWQRFKITFRYIHWHRVPHVIRTPIEYVYDHVFHGARPVKKGSYQDAQGSIHEDGIDVEFGGACPVQGEGVVDGRQVYYRSRGSGWSLDIAKAGAEDAMGNDTWCFAEAKYHWPDGGWVHADVSRDCIKLAVSLWRMAGRP